MHISPKITKSIRCQKLSHADDKELGGCFGRIGRATHEVPEVRGESFWSNGQELGVVIYH